MESADNFKKRLRGEEELPADFGWEHMEEGIFAKMATISPEPAAPETGRWWLILSLFLGILLLTGIVTGLYQWNQTQDAALTNLKVVLAEQQQRAEQKTVEHHIQDNADQNNETENATININSNQNHTEHTPIITRSTSEKAQLSNYGNHLRKIKKENIKSVQGANNQLVINELLGAGDLTNTKNEVTTFSKGTVNSNQLTTENHLLTPAQNEPESTLKNDILNQNPNSPTDIISTPKQAKTATQTDELAIEYLQQPTPTLAIPALKNISPSALNLSVAPRKKAVEQRFAIALSSGTNFWFANRGADSVSIERNEFETTQLGNNVGLELDYYLNNNWSLRSGLQIQNLNSRFDFTEVTTFQRLKENVVLGIQVSTFSQDSLEIRGDTLINVQAERSVRHYNQFKKWSVPIVLNYAVRRGKLEYQIGLGTLLTLQSTTSGRTIANQIIVDYNADEPIYRSGLEIALQAAVSMNYYFTKRYFIGAQLSANQYLTNWNIATEQIQRPLLLNGQLRVGMRF
ncbi:MAG: hypothetical protein AB8G22_20945 [Saprospiraceae bacterium]